MRKFRNKATGIVYVIANESLVGYYVADQRFEEIKDEPVQEEKKKATTKKK